MRDDFRIPDLTFPTVKYGRLETPWDLKPLLYFGGAKANKRVVSELMAGGLLRNALPERLELVQNIHVAIGGRLVGGSSVGAVRSYIVGIRTLFTWAEENQHPLTLEKIQATYLHWTDSLVHRYQVEDGINQNSAYVLGAQTAAVLDDVLGRLTPVIQLTRLRKPPVRKTARGVQAEKQNLEETFAFGQLLQDICDGLPINVVLNGALPVRIPLRSGEELIHWSGGRDGRLLAHREADGTLRKRYPLANLRLEAELLMFIGQTGMNLAQAHQLKLRHFFYASHLDGFQVKDRKHRKGGEVLFEIFKDYKPSFERFLEWRRQLFPGSDVLFPFVRPLGGTEQRLPDCFRLRRLCKGLGMRFVPPQALRNTRVNWLLRRSGDPELTAAMAQHTKETLLGVYERPSQQRAMVEVMRFWAQHDPALTQTASAAPGQCDGQPAPCSDIPKHATTPDCIRPSGCLWCKQHRDLDSQDYVWSLASFRHLKVIEVSKWHPPKGSRESHPAEHAISRISEKLRWFHDSNVRRRSWMEEALARIEESSYHPDWQRLIESMEGVV